MRRLTYLASLLAALAIPAGAAAQSAPITLSSARITVEGTSNVHDFTAATTSVRLTRVELGVEPGADLLAALLQPGAFKAFDVTVAAATLKSPKGDIDENMHKALKVREHADITFRLRSLEAAGASAFRAAGTLRLAGVEKEVVLTLQAERRDATLAVTGSTDLLMTDYGIAPPRAMLGVLKTNPKVTIRLELMLAAAN